MCQVEPWSWGASEDDTERGRQQVSKDEVVGDVSGRVSSTSRDVYEYLFTCPFSTTPVGPCLLGFSQDWCRGPSRRIDPFPSVFPLSTRGAFRWDSGSSGG